MTPIQKQKETVTHFVHTVSGFCRIALSRAGTHALTAFVHHVGPNLGVYHNDPVESGEVEARFGQGSHQSEGRDQNFNSSFGPAQAYTHTATLVVPARLYPLIPIGISL